MSNSLEPRLKLTNTTLKSLSYEERQMLLGQYNSDVYQLTEMFPQIVVGDIERIYQMCGRNLDKALLGLLQFASEKEKQNKPRVPPPKKIAVESKPKVEIKEIKPITEIKPKEEIATNKNVGKGVEEKVCVIEKPKEEIKPIAVKEETKETKLVEEVKEKPKEETQVIEEPKKIIEIKQEVKEIKPQEEPKEEVLIIGKQDNIPFVNEEEAIKYRMIEEKLKKLSPHEREERIESLPKDIYEGINEMVNCNIIGKVREIANKDENEVSKEIIEENVPSQCVEEKPEINVSIDGNECVIMASFKKNCRYKKSYLRIVDVYDDNLIKSQREIGLSVSFVWKLELPIGMYKLQYHVLDNSTIIDIQDININPIKMVLSETSNEYEIVLTEGPIEKVSWVGIYMVDGKMGRKYLSYSKTTGMVDNTIHIKKGQETGLVFCRAFSNDNYVGFIVNQYYTIGDSNQIAVA